MKKTQAQIIILLNQVEDMKKNPYFMSGHLGLSFVHIYNNFRALESIGSITKTKVKQRSVYNVTDRETVEEALNVFNNPNTD